MTLERRIEQRRKRTLHIDRDRRTLPDRRAVGSPAVDADAVAGAASPVREFIDRELDAADVKVRAFKETLHEKINRIGDKHLRNILLDLCWGPSDSKGAPVAVPPPPPIEVRDTRLR